MPPSILVDTNVIIEAVRTGCWAALTGQLRVETVVACRAPRPRAQPRAVNDAPHSTILVPGAIRKVRRHRMKPPVVFAPRMSPTIFKAQGLRFHFFSREEERMHIHVLGDEGEAKVWMEPRIEVAGGSRLSRKT